MIFRRASGGMTLCFAPAWKEPTETTAGSNGSFSRETSAWSATTVRAAMRTGSTVRCGIAPCPPLPWIVRSTESTEAKAGPGVTPTEPDGSSGVTWSARAKAGRGNRVKSPSFSIFAAPAPFSSAGCPTITSVPRQLPFARARSVAAPVQAVMWRSWPQACMTGIGEPSSPFPVARLANGSPVRSSTGRASRSVRSITTGPSPFRRTPTIPAPPTPSVTSNPRARRRPASFAAVAVSCIESSGEAWSSR